MRTAATDLLGIDWPIVQAPMGGASGPELAAAVSNAGGLGMLALSWHSIDALREEIRRTRELTRKPFGVNLVLAFPQEERLQACLEEGVDLVSFFWGDPAPFVARVHAAGALVASTVSSAAEALAVRSAGVDLIVAQGWEAGGHVKGEVATLPLVRAVTRAVGDAPVLAAGGISDGAALAAVLALGASGAWIGTAFLASSEARIHADYRARLVAADETATVHTELFDGGWPNAPHRVLRNSTYARWLAAGGPPAGARPGERELLATAGATRMWRYQSTTPGEAATGDVEALSLWSGQGIAGVTEVRPAAAIVADLVLEAGRAAQALTAIIDSVQCP